MPFIIQRGRNVSVDKKMKGNINLFIFLNVKLKNPGSDVRLRVVYIIKKPETKMNKGILTECIMR
jgi:hypothetical protein